MKKLAANADIEADPTVLQIRHRLEEHLHFRGRAHLFRLEVLGDSIVVTGRVPTYYLKQLLQEAIRAIPDVVRVENRVDVLFQHRRAPSSSGNHAAEFE